MKKVLIFATHPIQYQAPLFRLLANKVDLVVVYAFKSSEENQSHAGFGVKFKWDIPLLAGYQSEFAELKNPSSPNTSKRFGLVINKPSELLAKHKPDVLIVMGWFPYAMVQMISAGRKMGIPVYVRGDSNLQMKEPNLKSIFKRVYFKWLFSKITGFLYVGQLNKEFYQFYGVKEERLFNVPHSVDTHRFASEFKDCVKNSGAKITLGFAGKFIAKKNPIELINAITLLSNKEQLELLWIGDGPLRPELELLCQQKGISHQFTGFLNQSQLVSQGYSKLDLLILPSSFNETWGLVVNEVYCGSVPVITSDKVGCNLDLVASIDRRLVYPSGDVKSLALSISFALDNLDDIKEKISRVASNYTITKTSEGIIKAIH